MIKCGLKIWSNNTYLFKEIVERYNQGEFDFIELYSNSEVEHNYTELEKIKAVPVLGIHIGNLDKAGFHDFYLTEKQKKPWQMTVDLADFFNVSRIVVHPAVEHTLETFVDNLKKLNDERIIIETTPAKSPLRNTLRLFGTSLEDFREIRKNKQMCLDIPKTIKASIYHKIDYKEFLLKALDIIKPEYFHISGCNIKDPFDQHGNVYDAEFDVVWVHGILKDYSKNKDIYLVFETPKIADNLENDIKNIEYFKNAI